MRDMASDMAVRESVRPAVHSATATGETVDRADFEAATAVIATGAIAGSGDFTPKLQHSDTTTGGDFEDVPAGDLIGEFAATLEANATYRVGYVGGRRYLRAVLTNNSGTSIAASAVIVLERPGKKPAA